MHFPNLYIWTERYRNFQAGVMVTVYPKEITEGFSGGLLGTRGSAFTIPGAVTCAACHVLCPSTPHSIVMVLASINHTVLISMKAL